MAVVSVVDASSDSSSPVRRRAGYSEFASGELMNHTFYIGWLSTPLANYGWEISVANQVRPATAYRDLGSKSALEQL